MKDRPLFYNARCVWRHENDAELTTYTDWNRYEPLLNDLTDVGGISVPEDEKLVRYKGVYDRLGQEHINDTISHVKGKLFGQDLFKTDPETQFDDLTVEEYKKPKQ